MKRCTKNLLRGLFGGREAKMKKRESVLPPMRNEEEGTNFTHVKPGNDPVPPKASSELIDEAFSRAMNEYGEVLRRLADE
jgi:hypothetical protein